MRWQYDDGGRVESGYKGTTGDCVVRAIAIVSGESYKTVYNTINMIAQDERITRKHRKRSSARSGVIRKTYERYLRYLGWRWVPTMFIGSGCKVHLNDGEIPDIGRLVVRLSKHITAVVDGVVHDTYDPSREGSRCVYGYWIAEE